MNSLQNLVNIREEANRPILAPRIRGGGSTPYSPSKKKTPYFHTKRQCSKISGIFWGKSYITIYTTATTATQKKANWNNPEKKSSLSHCLYKIIWDWCEEPERSISSAPKTRLSISQLFGTIIGCRLRFDPTCRLVHMHYQPQFKRLAYKHCGALSTYCLAEIINNQKTIMSTDYWQLGPWRSDGEDINLFTQNHSDQ